MRTTLLCAAAVLTLGGCVSTTNWQKALWEDGFIPLPTLAVVQVVEPDPKEAGKGRLVTRNALVGSYREARSEDFRRPETPWTWNEVSQLTNTDLPAQITGGADTLASRIGLTFSVSTLLSGGTMEASLGPSDSIALNRLWFLETPRLDRSNYHLVLRPLVAELANDPRPQSFFLLTKVLGGDIDAQKNASLKIAAKSTDARFPLKVDLGGGASWEFKGHGVALGVQGQIITKTARGSIRESPGQRYPLAAGDSVLRIGRDDVHLHREEDGRLQVRWTAVPDLELFVAGPAGSMQRVSVVPPGAGFILGGSISAAGGRLLVLQVGGNARAPAILAGATYDIALRNLDATTLVNFFATLDSASREAWARAIGSEGPLEDFLSAHQRILQLSADVEQAQISRYEIVEAFVPGAAKSGVYDHVRMTRYEVDGMSGKKFRFEVVRQGAVGIVRSRLWVENHDGALEDITPSPNAFTSTSVTLVIPAGAKYLYFRSGLRHEQQPVNITGFHSGRFSPVSDLAWDAAFVPPLGAQCRLIFGEATPDAPILPVRTRGRLSDWAARILAEPTRSTDVEIRAVQQAAAGEFEICRFSAKDVGRKVGWFVHQPR